MDTLNTVSSIKDQGLMKVPRVKNYAPAEI